MFLQVAHEGSATGAVHGGVGAYLGLVLDIAGGNSLLNGKTAPDSFIREPGVDVGWEDLGERTDRGSPGGVPPAIDPLGTGRTLADYEGGGSAIGR